MAVAPSSSLVLSYNKPMHCCSRGFLFHPLLTRVNVLWVTRYNPIQMTFSGSPNVQCDSGHINTYYNPHSKITGGNAVNIHIGLVHQKNCAQKSNISTQVLPVPSCQQCPNDSEGLGKPSLYKVSEVHSRYPVSWRISISLWCQLLELKQDMVPTILTQMVWGRVPHCQTPLLRVWTGWITK